MNLVDVVLHLDTHLLKLVAEYGVWVYGILFAIIFSETGFVVTPFLPGDSLLFVAGAIAATGELNVYALVAVLALAAILGNTVNYAIGRWLGKRFFTEGGGSRWLNRKHLDKAHEFYDRHGGKAVVISRFLPIVRTYVPFVAGMAAMTPREFTMYNVAGGVLWVGSLTAAGFFFGNIPWVKGNLTAIIIGIVVVSMLPLVFAFVKGRMAKKAAGA
ncbi:MAG: DedA family protein [Usitatibacter sp.]